METSPAVSLAGDVGGARLAYSQIPIPLISKMPYNPKRFMDAFFLFFFLRQSFFKCTFFSNTDEFLGEY